MVAETRLGFAGVALSPNGIVRATLFHPEMAGARGELEAHGAAERPDPRAAPLTQLLQSYAAGQPVSLDDYPVDPPGGDSFRRRAWLALRDIPRGETRSYAWLARRAGSPSARAAGAATGSNPIPLWLPCHRVVGSDGSLHGFGGGLEMKRRLLELEGALPASLF